METYEWGVFNERLADATATLVEGRPDCLDIRGTGGLRECLAAAAACRANDVRVRRPKRHVGLMTYVDLLITGDDVSYWHQWAQRHPAADDTAIEAAIHASYEEPNYAT